MLRPGRIVAAAAAALIPACSYVSYKARKKASWDYKHNPNGVVSVSAVAGGNCGFARGAVHSLMTLRTSQLDGLKKLFMKSVALL